MPFITDPNTGNQIWDGESVPSASRESVRNSITELNEDLTALTSRVTTAEGDIEALDERLDVAEAAFTLDVEDGNIGAPASNLNFITTGVSNTLIGAGSGGSISSGSSNTSVGLDALSSATTLSTSVAVGSQAGNDAETGTGGVFIGYSAQPSSGTINNEIVIGFNALGNGANTTTIGNGSTLTAYIKGNLIIDGMANSIRLGPSSGTAPSIAPCIGIPIISAAEGSIRLSDNGNIYVYKSATWREVAIV